MSHEGIKTRHAFPDVSCCWSRSFGKISCACNLRERLTGVVSDACDDEQRNQGYNSDHGKGDCRADGDTHLGAIELCR